MRAALVRYTAPDVLKARIRAALVDEVDVPERPRRASGTRWTLVAGWVAVLAASNVATFALTRARAVNRDAHDAVLESHVRSLLPGHLVDVASTNQHNVKPWFNGRAPLSPPVPSLEDVDFHLVGGRIDYIDARPAAVVVYSRRLHMINVYASAAPDGEWPVAWRHERGFHVAMWRSGGVAFSVVSDLNARELEEFTTRYRAANATR